MNWWEFIFQGPGLAVILPAGMVVAGCVLAMIGQRIADKIGGK